MIEFKGVSKQYGTHRILESYNLSINDGEFFVLVGPSGSGKTTTLKMINRLIEPTDGDIYFDQKRLIDYDLKELRLTIGYVLQQIALFPNMTVAENIELIPEMKRWKKEERRERTKELLTKVGLPPEEYMQRKPAELSGGEQQRIGILRAIAAKPDIILMDEPFSALDPISKTQLQELIKDLHKEMASTIIFVTHDMTEAMKLGDRICIMQDGKIIQVDTPEQIKAAPENEFVAQFFHNEASGLEKYKVSDLVDELVILEDTSDYTVVEPSISLQELISLLAANPVVVVKEQEQTLGTLTAASVINFLDKKAKGAVTNE